MKGLFYLLIGCVLLNACSSNEVSDSTIVQEMDSSGNALFETVDSLITDMESVLDSTHKALKGMHDEYFNRAMEEKDQRSFFEIEFFGAYDITKTTIWFDSNGKPVYSYEEMAAEGGYEENTFEVFKDDRFYFSGQRINDGGTPIERYRKKGMDYSLQWKKIEEWEGEGGSPFSKEVHPESPEEVAKRSIEAEKNRMINEWLKLVAEDEFRRDGRIYIYRNSRMENSEYGPIETGQEIRMDSLCFRKFFPKR